MLLVPVLYPWEVWEVIPERLLMMMMIPKNKYPNKHKKNHDIHMCGLLHEVECIVFMAGSVTGPDT